MNKSIIVFTMLMAMGVMAGCAGNREMIKTMSTSTSQDIFKVVADKSSPEPGYVDLRIYSSLKTYGPGTYSEKDVHGTPDYTMLVNIDGQAIDLKGRLREERSEARFMRDAEEGSGIRYQFETKLRIKAGSHKIVVSIPADGLVTVKEVVFTEGEINSLTIEPRYGTIPGKQRLGLYGMTSFKRGVRSVRLLLNGKAI